MFWFLGNNNITKRDLVPGRSGQNRVRRILFITSFPPKYNNFLISRQQTDMNITQYIQNNGIIKN